MDVRLTSSALWITKACLLLAWMATASAQSPAPLTDPDLELLTNGVVIAIARPPDGGVLLGGVFTSIDGVARSNLARLRPDGTLDLDWNPSPNGAVQAIAVSSAGDIFVGGDFTAINGQPRLRLAKFEPGTQGALDALWAPAANNGVNALVVAGGAVYVGGRFTAIGSDTRGRLARVAATGTGVVDAEWNPSADAPIAAVAVDGANAVYAGGTFANIGGAARANLAKLSISDGTAVAAWNPSADAGVNALVLDGSGALYAGGAFTEIGSIQRSYLARLSTSGAGVVDPVWNPAPSGSINALALDAGNLFVGGWFSSVESGLVRNLAKVSTAGTGTADTGWDPSPDNVVRSIAVDGAGGVIAGGQFGTVGKQVHLAHVRISSTGTAQDSVDVEQRGAVITSIAEQADGSKIIGGAFSKVGTLGRRNLLRLDAQGRLDAEWAPDPDGMVSALAVVGDQVYVAGAFQTIRGVLRQGLARIDGTGLGLPDEGWNMGVWGSVNALEMHSHSLYVGGSFAAIGGVQRQGLAKIDLASGLIDPDWNVAANADVVSIVSDGKDSIFVGGGFIIIGGIERRRLAKVSADGAGAVDPLWNPAPNQQVTALAIDADGRLYAGGLFTSIGGQPRARIARLSTDGTAVVDPTWNPSPSGSIHSLAVSASGSIYASGLFTSIGGMSRRYLARLSPDGAGSADATWNPSPNSVNSVLHLDHEGMVFVGGTYTSIGNQPRIGIAALTPAGVRVAVDSDQTYVRPGNVLEHVVTVSNLEAQPAVSVVIGTTLPPEFEPSSVTWQCAASSGGSCGGAGSSGSGPLPASIDVGAKGSVVFVLTGTVGNGPGERVSVAVDALFGGEFVNASDETAIVLFRDGFEADSDDVEASRPLGTRRD